MKGTKFISALLLLALSTFALAEIYTWKDTKGRVHYSDQPPTEADAKTIKSRSPSAPEPDASAAASAPKGWKEKDQEARQKKAEQAQADEKKKLEQTKQAEKETYCNNLRKDLAMLERGGRVGRPNDKGELEYFSDEQMGKEAEKLRARIAQDCK